MKRVLIDALETCLQEMEKGKARVDILVHYPILEAQLDPLLEVAEVARDAGPLDIPVKEFQRERIHFLATARHLQHTSAGHFLARPPIRVALAALLALVFLVFGFDSVLAASANSLPGDLFYPIKRWTENVELQFSPDNSRRQQLAKEFDQRRQAETIALLLGARVERVEFEGTVTAAFTDVWTVADIPVRVSAQTEISGQIEIGDRVRVVGETEADGSVHALSLTRMDSAQDNDPLDEIQTPGITDANQPKNTHLPFQATSRPQNTQHPATNTPRPTNTPMPDNTHRPATNTLRPTNTHMPENTRRPATNTPRPKNTSNPDNKPAKGGD